MKYTQLELAKIFGQPLDPRKPYTDLVTAVCETDTGAPNDYYYYYDALLETDKVIISNTASGLITQENVSPDTPALITFVDYASPEYYIDIKDLASSKEKTIARKLRTINRALNSYEDYIVITLLDSAVGSSGNSFSMRSGYTRFVFPDLVDMVDSLADYADDYALVTGGTVNKDITNWVFDDNKYKSLTEAMADLGVASRVRIGAAENVTVDGVATAIINASHAYLVGRSSPAGKPALFVRKRLSEIEMLGGLINEQTAPDSRPERIIFGSQNPVQVGSNRHLAIGICGYEQFASAVTNIYSVAKYARA
jgi:hypothetical protein